MSKINNFNWLPNAESMNFEPMMKPIEIYGQLVSIFSSIIKKVKLLSILRVLVHRNSIITLIGIRRTKLKKKSHPKDNLNKKKWIIVFSLQLVWEVIHLLALLIGNWIIVHKIFYRWFVCKDYRRDGDNKV